MDPLSHLDGMFNISCINTDVRGVNAAGEENDVLTSITCVHVHGVIFYLLTSPDTRPEY